MQKKQPSIRGKIRWGIAGIFFLLLFATAYDIPHVFNRGVDWANRTLAVDMPRISDQGFRLGLDLRGGLHLIYQADMNSIPSAERADAVEGVRDVIERRVNGIGVGEANVQSTKVGDDYRLIVDLPGIDDANQAIAMIGETPILEFRTQNTEPPRALTSEEQAELDLFNASAKKRAEEALAKMRAGTAFVDIVNEYSEEQASKNNGGYVGFLGPNSPVEEIYAWAKTHKDAEVSDSVIETLDGFNILKRGAERDGTIQVSAKHILICFLGAKNCTGTEFTKDEALARAQELFELANADNFADLAKENSTEPGADVSGGDLGVFGRGAMVPAFEEAVFQAQVGQIVGPVETEFGFHVIYKTEETTPKEYEISRMIIAKKTAQQLLPSQDPWKPTALSGKQLERSEVVTDPQTGGIQVALRFDKEGKELFAQLTKENIGKPIAIYLDGSPISIPMVQTEITGGEAVISGNFTVAEARELSQRLNTGALPVPIELVSQQSIGASLGAQSLANSLKAGTVGVALVMVFMILYYRLPGVLSVVALGMYIAVSLAVFKLIDATLTLAGIAGFILSIGMAVDANVLIFERMKEELRQGKSLKASVEEGFLRAWSSIRDSNISSLISCAFLIWFGSSFVQGFAATLAIGVLVSMFSAITVTRVMLRFVVPWFKEEGNFLFLGSKRKESNHNSIV